MRRIEEVHLSKTWADLEPTTLPAMALLRALTPALVLCDACRTLDDSSHRIAALADAESGAVLVRDVCAAADCVERQLRGWLCADHALDYELAWQHHIPVRACSGCRQSVLLLYQQQIDVWFILAHSHEAKGMREVELRLIDKSTLETRAEMAFQSPVRAAKDKAKQKLSSSKKRIRRSARTLRQICDRERQRALEWRLGNTHGKPLFLWKDNKKRTQVDKMHHTDPNASESTATKAESTALPDPITFFCAAPKCRFFAKSGDRCRFHSSKPLSVHLATAPAATGADKPTAMDLGTAGSQTKP